MAPGLTLSKKPIPIGKTPQTQDEEINKSPVPVDVCNAALHPPPYAPADTVSPPSPLLHDIQPRQDNPYLSPESTKSVRRDMPSCNKNLLPSQTNGSAATQASKEVCNHPSQRGTPNINRTVSPTMTWTNLPASQPPQQLEMPNSRMVVDSTADPN